MGSLTAVLACSDAALHRGGRPRARRPRLLRDLDRTSGSAGIWADVAWLAIVVIPGRARARRAGPAAARRALGRLGRASAFAAARGRSSRSPTPTSSPTSRGSERRPSSPSGSSASSRRSAGSSSSLDHPVGRRLLGVARADEVDRRAPRARLHRALVRVPACPACTRPRTSACPTSSSSRSSSPPRRGSGCASAGRGSAWSPRSAARSR